MSFQSDLEASRQAAYGKTYQPVPTSSKGNPSSSNTNNNDFAKSLAQSREAAYAPKPVIKTVVSKAAQQPVQKQSNFFDNIVSGTKNVVKNVVNTVTGQKPPQTAEEKIKKQALTPKDIQYQEQLNKSYHQKQAIDNPANQLLTKATNAIDAAFQNIPDYVISSTVKAGVNAVANPDKAITRAQNFLAKPENQNITRPLAFVQSKILEPSFESNPVTRGLQKGVAETYLGDSKKTMEVFNKSVDKPVSFAGKTFYTVGEIAGQTMSFLAGGAVTKGLGLGKAALPVLFTTLGQTSSPADMTVLQRLEKAPVDAVAGWLISKVPAANKLLSTEALKQAGISAGILSGNTFVDSLIEGLSSKEAAVASAQMAVTAGLFHIAGTATGLFTNKLLESKYAKGNIEMTPDQARTQANATDFASPNAVAAREVLLKAADHAEAVGKNLSINIDVAQRSGAAKLFQAKTPNDKSFFIDFVEPTKIELLQEQKPSSATQPETTSTAPIPDVVAQEFNKSTETVKSSSDVIPNQSIAPDYSVMREYDGSVNPITINHGTSSTPEEIAQRGVRGSRNSSEGYGNASFFTDKATSEDYGDNNVSISTQGLKFKIFPTKRTEVKFMEQMGENNLSDAIRKEGKFDGFMIPNSDPEVGNTFGITNLDKINETITGKSKDITPSKDIEPSVMQIVNTKTNAVEYKTIPKGQLADFHNLIDDTQHGIAGKEIDGKIYHLTAKTPEQMNDKGATFSGMAKIEDVPGHKGDTKSAAPSEIILEKKPINKDFYIRQEDGFHKIEGKSVSVGGGLDTFVHKSLDGGEFVVSEGITGIGIASGETRQMAINNAREAVVKNEDKIREATTNLIKEHGESPRYAIINDNEGQATGQAINKNIGGNNRSRQSPDLIQSGHSEQATVGEAAKVNSGEVARRQRGVSNNSAGKRSATRIKNPISDKLSNIPSSLQEEALSVWNKEYSEIYAGEKNQSIKDNLVEAFVNKYELKATAENKPIKESKITQVEINKQIEALIAEKGLDAESYTAIEKNLLKQYSGSGGLEKGGAEGRGLLDEYYTPKPIVDFMWKKVKELKPEIKSMLEPSVGIGTFLDKAKGIEKIHAMEINKTSSTITQILHPEVNVVTKPFEDIFVDFQGNKKSNIDKYDLVIGNPPYGEHRGRYLGLGEESKIKSYEDYFLKRGMDVLNDNGILAFVVPSSFLREGSSEAKYQISKMGTIEDAYRLPNGAFDNTTIGTDIIFLRKRIVSDTNIIADRAIGMSNDNFFDKFSDNILGKTSKSTGNFGADEVVGNLQEAMKLAESKSIELSETIPDSEIKVIEQNEAKEVEQSIQATKENIIPSSPRVVESEVVMNDLNRKAQIIPNKKDAVRQLSNVSAEEGDMWKSVIATGQIEGGILNSFYPKTFLSETMSIDLSSGKALYYPNIIYYQGNIYEKLDNLELFKNQINPHQYAKQKAKLESVLPTPQSLENTALQPVSDFIRKMQLPVDKGTVGLIDLFRLYMNKLPRDVFGSSSSWEIEGYISGSVVNSGDKLQNIEVRKRRRITGNSIFKRFTSEMLTPEQKSYIESRYNRNFNAYYRPDYKTIPLISTVNSTFNPSGKKGNFPLVIKDIQKEGAAFLASKGTGLLAYDVGVGKTLTAIVAINEVMKRGWAKRPLIVVPNGVYRNWITEISEIMPKVKINSLVNLGAAFKGDLKTLQVEQNTLSIITYDGLVKLGFKPETYDGLTKDLQDVMVGSNSTKRGKAKEEAGIEEQIGRAIKGTTNQRFFEDLGFDHLTIDEVHNFKNIFAGAKVKRGGGNEFTNVRGSSSARGIKAYLMAQYIMKNNNNRNVFLLSATPFTNSPMEIYSILSLMGKQRLEEMGLKNVNDFMSMFMELKPTFTIKADQSVKEEDTIEKFQNLQQLQKMVTEFIDFRTGEEAGVDRPGRSKRTVSINPNALQTEYIAKAQELFDPKMKDKGGAIVGITELQNITLSPYLSRYNTTAPTSVEFVENSPKIKYAIELATQVHKDNPEATQVIYMPRGVGYFPLVKEYLVKQKGFAPSEVDQITGGMTLDAKQTVQQNFNSGKVKILLGTEAIKEGINLQERSTDLYHLHLPWNPTDMLQVEGRIWRQGNQWSNVRIHYPLIENSVDSFIFQKLETKEKRIKNLWSYKDKEISLGDLNFEEMKLDLITNPVIRVAAEKTFEVKKQQTMLETLKVEKAFTERRISKFNDARERLDNALKSNENALKAKDMLESSKKYYQERVDYAQKAFDEMSNNYKKQHIAIPDLEDKLKELDTNIETHKKTLSEINVVYEKKTEEAKVIKESTKIAPTDYMSMTKAIKEENKTFFIKKNPKIISHKSGGGGNASIGDYADIPKAEESVANIRSVEFPELLRLAKEMMGNTPTLKEFPKALGRFYDKNNGEIRLNPEIFKKPDLAAKVFAHELGHLADYLPEKTLVRGNLIGRLNSLNKYLKKTYGESEIENADIRNELKNLSKLWKPFDELESLAYTNYRYSSKELYADSISVLFNDPALLKNKAPLFWKEFFLNMDKKPEVKKNFEDVWATLNQGEEKIFEQRDAEMNKAFDSGEKAFTVKELEKRKKSSNLLFQLQILFDDINKPIWDKVREAQKKGAGVLDANNPAFGVEGLNYLDGKVKNYIAENFQPVFEKAQSVPDGWNTLGKILQLERTIYERGELANPGGYDPKTAQMQLTALEAHTSPEEWKILQSAKERFRAAVQQSIADAEKAEYYTPELIKVMKANPAYASYQVIDYLDTNVSAKVYKSVGTLKDIANPATSTVMKVISLVKAIERNNVKIDAIDLLKSTFRNEIEDAKTVFMAEDKPQQILEPKNQDQGLVITMRKGKAAGYYVDKNISNSLNYISNDTMRMASSALRMISLSPFYRPLFTTFNLGFQAFNSIRDFQRYWKNVPDSTFLGALTSLPRAIVRYGQATPHAIKNALDLPDQIIKEMENSKILGLRFSDVFKEPVDPEDKQIERVLRRIGILDKKEKRGIFTPIFKVLGSMETLGNFLESLPKVAGYIELKGKMPEQELAHFIRNYVGSPNFRTKGSFTPVSNNIFLFSNAIKEGIKSDYKIATGQVNKASAAGFWWKTLLSTIVPSLFMAAIGAGFFGKYWKDIMDGASEYIKSNYTVIPIGMDENGKPINLTIPRDETSRFIGALFWKAMNMTKGSTPGLEDFMQIIAVGAGNFPNLTPSFTGIGAVLSYATGNNPYDSFRNRNVIPDKEFQAGPKYSLPIFMNWLLKQQGAGIIIPSFVATDPGKLEKLTGLPVLSNILGRFIRVSDYGQIEQLNKESRQALQEKSQKNLEQDQVIQAAIKEYHQGEQNPSANLLARITLTNQILQELPPADRKQARAALRTKINKEFLKADADSNTTALLKAVSNDQKARILNKIYDRLSTKDYADFEQQALRDKVISRDVLKKLRQIQN